MLLSILFAALMTLIAYLVRKSSFLDRQKRRPFECGFSSKRGARLPVSLRFFLIAVIFLIFDVELVLLFPFLVALRVKSFIYTFSVLLIFFIILVAGLFYEWSQGILDWAS